MSIAVLTQVYDEARRLAVAGSVVAAGDFRLKKLIPPLEQAGAKAPVFAKVTEAAKAVVDGPEEKSAESLLELTSLVSAVLYTQGETGAAGELKPIPSVNLGGQLAQTPARVLKPLLEALSSTGSGRLELVKEAHQQGAFRDLRLVMPALKGLDDPYAEIADFLAQKVLPQYGTAILSELKDKYDPAGTKGHPRRLKLMHALDPAGTKELVKQALDGKETSKEVRVAAIGLLGVQDLDFLIEQVGAKAGEVRTAAYEALARIDDPRAAAALAKALAGKDWEAAANAIEHGRVDRHVEALAADIRTGADALVKLKEKKAAGQAAHRLVYLVNSLPAGSFPAADAVLLDLFARRAELAKVKGDHHSGTDVVQTAVNAMAAASPAVAKVLADAHAAVEPVNLDDAFRAARRVLTPAEVYDRFSSYLTDPAAAKKGTNPARDKQEAIIGELNGRYITWFSRTAPDPDDEDDEDRDNGPLGKLPPHDQRWLDLAVRMKHLALVDALYRADRPHPGAQAVAKAAFDEAFAKAKGQDRIEDPLSVLVHVGHPEAAACLAASYERTVGKANASTYWYTYLILQLPKSAVPVLEAVIPKIKDQREADRFAEAVQELREKKEPDKK